MIIESMGRRKVNIRYRNEDGERQHRIIEDVWHYCFVETEHAPLFDAASKEDGYLGVYGEKLTKLVVATPAQIRDVKAKADLFSVPTWEANVPYVNRAICDHLKSNFPIPYYDHRIWYLDCEWSPTTNKMRVIVVKDSFTNNEYVWFVNPALELTEEYSEFGDYQYDVPARGFPNERLMLVDFLRHMGQQDPDVITGWYVTGADVKQIIERCRLNGIEPRSLSPMNRLRYEFGDWAQPIVGRMCIDLMIATAKLWELKNGKLPGYKLDDVAFEILGERKIELPDGHDTYLSDLPLYVHYCRQDVRLLPKLDLKVNAINYYLALQHLVQCDIRTTPFITKMFTCLALQDSEWERRIPSRPQFDKVDYEGADIMEVAKGLYENVGILDVMAMYHSNAKQYNISWEMLDSATEDGVDCGNGTCFLPSNGKTGMLVRQMDNMTVLRNQFKEARRNAETGEERQRWDTMQYACKSLVASMYGVAGDSKYGLYHPEIAAAITHTSRQTLNKLKEEAEKQGLEVFYGHTDSVFVTMSSPEEGEEALREINDEMRPIEVQFEKWCERMLLIAKNRYAANVVWSDGVGHKDTLYIKGIEMKQSRMPVIMKDCMKDVIGGILSGESEKEVTESVTELILKVIEGEVEPANLCMKGKLEKNLSDYKVLSGPSAGAAWANEFLGKGYRKGSFFLVTLNNEGKYIAFDDPKEIEGKYTIGFKELAERFIVKKVMPYFNLMGWDSQPLFNTLRGLGSLTWI